MRISPHPDEPTEGPLTEARPRGRILRNGTLVAAALVAVVAGSAKAGSLITSSQIASNTIRGRDIHDNSIKGVDVKNGSLRRRDFNLASIRGPQGASGTAGAQGPQGPPGLNGVRAVRVLSTTVPSAAGFAKLFVACDPGETILGGGAESATPVDFHVSTPFITSAGINGWLAEASVRTGAFSMDVKAVCGSG